MRSARLVAIFSLALGAALVSGAPAGATDGDDVVLRDLSLLTDELGSLQDGPRILGDELGSLQDGPRILGDELGSLQDGPRILGGDTF